MLCSECNKNNAVVFINKQDSNGNVSLEGLCYECAKKRGINPIDSLMKQANLSEDDINNMTKQFETMFKDMSENINFAELPDDFDDDSYNDKNAKGMHLGAMPLRFNFFKYVWNGFR